MSNPVRVGVIGYGYWGPNLVRNYMSLETCSVRMVADMKQENLHKMQSLYPLVTPTTNAEDILANPDIDAISIATPASTHFALAKQALENGKHVLIEKPMTQTAQEARTLIELARKKGLILMVGHTFVYSSAVRKLKELVQNGDLGQLYYFDSARINLGLMQRDTNVLWDLAPHDFSILSYLIEEAPASVQAHAYRHVGKQFEELASIEIGYESGFHAQIRVSWLSPVKMRLAFLAGSKKMAVYDDVEPSEKIKIYDKGVAYQLDKEEITPAMPIYRAGDVLIPALDRTEALKVEVMHFISCIQHHEQPITGGEAGLRVVELLEATEMSLRSNSAVISVQAVPSLSQQ